MVRIEKTHIRMTRGDTLILNLSMSKNGAIFTPASGDVITFTLKKKAGDATALVTKTAVGTQIKVDPEDTKPLAFGSYVYDIAITYANGDVDTFIPMSPLTLEEEVG